MKKHNYKIDQTISQKFLLGKLENSRKAITTTTTTITTITTTTSSTTV